MPDAAHVFNRCPSRLERHVAQLDLDGLSASALMAHFKARNGHSARTRRRKR